MKHQSAKNTNTIYSTIGPDGICDTLTKWWPTDYRFEERFAGPLEDGHFFQYCDRGQSGLTIEEFRREDGTARFYASQGLDGMPRIDTNTVAGMLTSRFG